MDRSTLWTETVRRGVLVRQVPAHGTLVPEHVQWLSAVSAARVARIVVRPGARVEPETVVLARKGIGDTDAPVAHDYRERPFVDVCGDLVRGRFRTGSVGVEHAVGAGLGEGEADALRALVVQIEVLAQPCDGGARERHV